LKELRKRFGLNKKEEMVAIRPTRPHWPVLIVASWLSAASVQAAQPLFDAHLHYNAEDAAHCDPAVIDALFEQVPEATVIWAHAGAYPYPPLLRDYLERYPGLYIDLSVRDQRIAPDGQLDPQWELLLLAYPGRFMVGVDTFSAERWHAFAEVANRIRNWLAQLPAEVSDAIAYRNAARVFGQSVDN
jgi:predicted TIM-barrel fold metal-dependent hydrolase